MQRFSTYPTFNLGNRELIAFLGTDIQVDWVKPVQVLNDKKNLKLQREYRNRLRFEKTLQHISNRQIQRDQENLPTPPNTPHDTTLLPAPPQSNLLNNALVSNLYKQMSQGATNGMGNFAFGTLIPVPAVPVQQAPIGSPPSPHHHLMNGEIQPAYHPMVINLAHQYTPMQEDINNWRVYTFPSPQQQAYAGRQGCGCGHCLHYLTYPTAGQYYDSQQLNSN